MVKDLLNFLGWDLGQQLEHKTAIVFFIFLKSSCFACFRSLALCASIQSVARFSALLAIERPQNGLRDGLLSIPGR